MAKKSMIAKAKRTPKHKVQGYHRCTVCGRPRAFIRRFALRLRDHGLLGHLDSSPP